MDKAKLRKTIFATLESWQKLDDARRGPNFAETENRLEAWAEELEKPGNDDT